MKSAEYLDKKLNEWKKNNKPLMWITWQLALLCVGMAYVFGARGVKCTPGNRRAYYGSHADHPTIRSKCQVIREEKPKDSCEGCKWYPDKKRTLFFDCMGFEYWLFLKVYGFKIQGAGATSQWKTKSNWKERGTIDTCPTDQLVVLYAQNKAKKTLSMKHAAIGWGNETIECAVGVQHKKKRDAQFTHWGIPACMAEDYVPHAEKPKEDKVSEKVIKKGASGSKVKELQKLLIAKGYSCGPKGADGKFGDDTLAAVKKFQQDWGLKADGIVGPETMKMLQNTPEKAKTYTVTISGQTKSAAQEICAKYPGAVMKEEK